MKVTAIFDIGKTNKKCILFDRKYRAVFKEYVRFEEIKDEDGFPCDNLAEIEAWTRKTFHKVLADERFEIEAVNFSTYGASFVHIDQHGQPVAPLYNYLKPFPEKLLGDFRRKYGDELTFARKTASPPLGMLNSGLQLYWLKYTKPVIFKNIRWSLHFPQYMSYLFTGKPVSEYTSIGCHTGLWDYSRNDYHDWIYAEGIDRILPPIVETCISINRKLGDKELKVGVGIHDSSSALQPYIRSDKKPFVLISTGTWSISINPYNDEELTEEDLRNDCLNFLRIDGLAVKASRLFLGNEYHLQMGKLHDHFGKNGGYYRQLKFDEATFDRLQSNYERRFRFESIELERKQPETTDLAFFTDFREAYHQLMMELTELQIRSTERAMGNTQIEKIYIDGGFADNDLYLQLLSRNFPDIKLRSTRSPLGSAIGAAMVISGEEPEESFLKKHYVLRKIPKPD